MERGTDESTSISEAEGGLVRQERHGPLLRVGRDIWELPIGHRPGMLVPGRIYGSESLLPGEGEHEAIQQVANVATLPGIVRFSLAMPDFHWGYGFPIGGVAAMRPEDGVISPGGVGFDINCGVRLIATNLSLEEIEPVRKALTDQLFRDIPPGMAEDGPWRLDDAECDRVLADGARCAVERGWGLPEDLARTESGGRMENAEPSGVSVRARARGRGQLGTIGSGNHFIEVQVVDRLLDAAAGRAFGLSRGQVVVMVHTGSRGLGHQVCTDYLEVAEEAAARHGVALVDRQLACAPVRSPEGQAYLGAMNAAANFAWANRQVITHSTRMAFARVLARPAEELGMRLVYDVSHNMAKFEEHEVDGERRTLCVHRKGATRAFPAGHREVPAEYRDVGQPVLVPGDMGTASYVCVGLPDGMALSWGSTCHGAGRRQSRTRARKSLAGVDIRARLAERQITVRARNPRLLAEEATEAYKDVETVVRVLDDLKIARRVARLVPVLVIKG